MRYPLRLIAALACCVFFAGCASPERVVRSWKGHHIDEVISQWGQPTRSSFDEGRGGRYTWHREWEQHFEEYTEIKGKIDDDGTFHGTSRVIPARTEHYSKTFWLTTDADNLVVDGGASRSGKQDLLDLLFPFDYYGRMRR